MSKRHKEFAQDVRTVMLGRPPIQSSMLQQMFYKCVSAALPSLPSENESKVSSQPLQPVNIKQKG